MTATSDAGPDPLAALPLLAEAGVSVYWQLLDGRTAWVADPDTRRIWISRATPRSALLGCLIQALQVIDDGVEPASDETPRLRLVHAADRVEHGSGSEPPTLRAIPDQPGTR